MGGVGSGGRRVYTGQVPDPSALKRQRDGKEWTKLPAAGRLGLPPEWPAAVEEPSPAELLKWREVWTLPQALVWEADRAHDLVAFYVRTFLHAMSRRASAQHQTLVRQLSNDLLLAPTALAAARYVIEGTPEASALDAATAPAAGPATKGSKRRGSARSRLTVVQPEDDEDDSGENDDSTHTARPETDQAQDDGEVPPF